MINYKRIQSIILSANLNHYSLSPLLVTLGSAELETIPTCRESGPPLVVQCIAANNTFIYTTLIKWRLEFSSISSQIRVACNKHVVYCTSKFVQLNEQTK